MNWIKRLLGITRSDSRPIIRQEYTPQVIDLLEGMKKKRGRPTGVKNRIPVKQGKSFRKIKNPKK